MSNLYRMLKNLLPDAPLLVGVVQSVEPGGCRVRLSDGGEVFARGAGNVSDSVFVRDGVIEGSAPALTAVLINV